MSEPPIELQPVQTATRSEVLRLIEATHNRALHEWSRKRNVRCECARCRERRLETPCQP